ncbi:agamous-like MADS-box protein AGL62, partial [Tanacetum coccineum]
MKVLVRADDLANMESASMLFLGPSTWNHLPINTFDNAPMNMQVFADGIKIENNTIIGLRNGLDFGDGIKIENNTIIGLTNGIDFLDGSKVKNNTINGPTNDHLDFRDLGLDLDNLF